MLLDEVGSLCPLDIEEFLLLRERERFLRAAVQQANATAGDDTINFAPTLANQTIPGGISIESNTDIDASGVANLSVSGMGNIVIRISGENTVNLTGIASSELVQVSAAV